jgi:hypothetical protein
MRRTADGRARSAGPHLGQWENPAFDWGHRTAWRLFNAATHILAGRVAENPVITRQLPQVIDGVCQHFN